MILDLETAEAERIAQELLDRWAAEMGWGISLSPSGWLVGPVYVDLGVPPQSDQP